MGLSADWIQIKSLKWLNTGNVQKIDVLKYLNARRHMAALGIQSMFLPMSYGGASIEWVKQSSVFISQ